MKYKREERERHRRWWLGHSRRLVGLGPDPVMDWGYGAGGDRPRGRGEEAAEPLLLAREEVKQRGLGARGPCGPEPWPAEALGGSMATPVGAARGAKDRLWVARRLGETLRG